VPQPALVEPLRRWDPEQIGGYVLVGRLGAGAMGRVYLGRSAAGRLVAVKTIKIELADEPDFRTRFAQEVAAARRVSGAFTAAVVAADPEADMPWLATAYVPAPSLAGLVRTCGPLPVPAVRWLAAGCAEALESIHGAGLVHRDLKPSNVLVSPDGPRVIDFGVARAAERIQLTVTRGAVGTPAYMAPEQARDTRQATMASDIFSLGATMLFAATGHAPYQGETVMDVLVRLATEPPDLSGLDRDLTDIVVACLERDPRKRPTSASVVAHLAPGISMAADGRELGPSSLPASALTLIGQYRRDPRPSASAEISDQDGEDVTFGSQPALTGSGPASAPRRAWPRRGGPGREHGAAGGAGTAQPGATAGPGRRARSRGLLVLAAVVTAAVLIAGGAAAGVSFADRQPKATATSHTSAQTGAGRPPPLGGPPPGGPPPFARSAAALSANDGGKPAIAMSQPAGDGHTGFVVIGAGWAPGRRLTVTLRGMGASSEHPVADGAGTFEYVINQNHEFFPGELPTGTYHVVVTGPGHARAVTAFTVDPR
jgi:protein kinase-like protein